MNDQQNDTPESETLKPPPEPPLSCRMVGENGETDGRGMAKLFAAEAAAAGAFEPIQKDRHVKVVTKEKGTYEFDYATLEEVLRCTTKALSDNGLRLRHFLCDAPDGAREIHHILSHSSGAFIEAVQVIRLSDGDKWQAFGSAVTYARRYQVQCMLGVSAEHDDDGNAADGNTLTDSRDRGRPPEKRREPPPAPKEKAPPREAAKAPEEHPHAPPQEPAKPPTTPPPAPAAAPQKPAESGPGGPMTQAQNDAIRDGFKRLGLKGRAAVKFCKEVTGKNGTDFGFTEAEVMLATLKDEAKTQQALNAVAGGA